jgi:hypothetical protein
MLRRGDVGRTLVVEDLVEAGLADAERTDELLALALESKSRLK